MDEINEYQDKMMSNDKLIQQSSFNLRKTCKTIREVSLEDAMSSVGNLSMKGAQIPLIHKQSTMSKKGGFIKELRRRRCSEQRNIQQMEPNMVGKLVK